MGNIFLFANADINYLDSMIGVSIVLLILSLITEKFVDLLRKHIFKGKVKGLKNINNFRSNDLALEENKKKEINKLAIGVGVLVALIANASLFDLLTSTNPQAILFWPNGWDKDKWDIPMFIIGILFTGFFLSFGSKFFHDLLDTLYQTKEYKRKLQNPNTFKQNSSKDVLDFIETDSYELAVSALALHENELKRKYHDLIENLEIGNTVNNQIGIIANLKSKPPSDFPKFVSVKLSNGKSVKIDVESILHETGEAQIGLACRIQNPKNYGYTGSLGGVLLSSKNTNSKCLLTCSHVAMGGSSRNFGGFGDFDMEVQVLEEDSEIAIGKIIYAKLDSKNDTSIIQLEDDYVYEWNNELPNGHKFGQPISVNQLKLSDSISYYSSVRQEITKGSIHKRISKQKVLLRFEDSQVKSFVELIVLGNNYGGYWSTISEKGDSGSIVFDEHFNPFGMIIGGGNQFTYAIPLTQILEETKTRIDQSA